MNWSKWGLVTALCAIAAAQGIPEEREFDDGGHMERGYALANAGKRREAIEEYTRALSLNRQALGAKHLRTLTNMNLLASARLMSGDLAGAEPLLTETI